MPSEKANGAQVAVLGELHELTDITDAGNYLFYINLSALVLGDVLELFKNLKNRSSGTLKRISLGTFSLNNTKHAPVIRDVPDSVLYQVTYELNQVVGTFTSSGSAGTISVRDNVTGQTSGATGVLEFTDSESTPTELRIRVTSPLTPFQDTEVIEKDGATSNTITLTDATPAQSYDWSVVDVLGT